MFSFSPHYNIYGDEEEDTGDIVTYEIFSQTTLQNTQRQLEESQYSQYLERDDLHERDYKKRRMHVDDYYHDFDLAEYDTLEGIPEMQFDGDMDKNDSQSAQNPRLEPSFVNSLIRDFSIALNTPHNSKSDSTQESQDDDLFAQKKGSSGKDQSGEPVHDQSHSKATREATEPFATLASAHRQSDIASSLRKDPQTPPPRTVQLPSRREARKEASKPPTASSHVQRTSQTHQTHPWTNATSVPTPAGGTNVHADKVGQGVPQNNVHSPSVPSRSEPIPSDIRNTVAVNSFSVDTLEIDVDATENQDVIEVDSVQLPPHQTHAASTTVHQHTFSQSDAHRYTRAHSRSRSDTRHSIAVGAAPGTEPSEDPWDGYLELSTQLTTSMSQRVYTQPLLRGRTRSSPRGATSGPAPVAPGTGAASGQKKAVSLASRALAKRGSKRNTTGAYGVVSGGMGNRVGVFARRHSAFDTSRDGWSRSHSNPGLHSSARRSGSIFQLDLATDDGLEVLDVIPPPVSASASSLHIPRSTQIAAQSRTPVDTKKTSSYTTRPGHNALHSNDNTHTSLKSPTSPVSLASPAPVPATYLSPHPMPPSSSIKHYSGIRRLSTGYHTGGSVVSPPNENLSILNVYNSAMAKLQQLGLMPSDPSMGMVNTQGPGQGTLGNVSGMGTARVSSPHPVRSSSSGIEPKATSALQLATNTLRSVTTWNTVFGVLSSQLLVQEGLSPVPYVLGDLLDTGKNTNSPLHMRRPASLRKEPRSSSIQAKDEVLPTPTAVNTSAPAVEYMDISQELPDTDAFFSNVRKNLFPSEIVNSTTKPQDGGTFSATTSTSTGAGGSGGASSSTSLAVAQRDKTGNDVGGDGLVMPAWKRQVLVPSLGGNTQMVIQLDRLPVGVPVLISTTKHMHEQLKGNSTVPGVDGEGNAMGEDKMPSATPRAVDTEDHTVQDEGGKDPIDRDGDGVGEKKTFRLITTSPPTAVWQRFYCICHVERRRGDFLQRRASSNTSDNDAGDHRAGINGSGERGIGNRDSVPGSSETGRETDGLSIDPSESNTVPFRICYATELLIRQFEETQVRSIGSDDGEVSNKPCLLLPIPETQAFSQPVYSHRGDCVIPKYSVAGWIPVVHQTHSISP